VFGHRDAYGVVVIDQNDAVGVHDWVILSEVVGMFGTTSHTLYDWGVVS
jgi:hypothetical protein